jgi:hypothetical protein
VSVPEEWGNFVEKWTHDGALQTFGSREKFRKEARAMLAAAPKQQDDIDVVDLQPEVQQPAQVVTSDMVNRFLSWRLPDDFGPDAGILFRRPENKALWPVGTNLLTATQAEEMLKHVLNVQPAQHADRWTLGLEDSDGNELIRKDQAAQMFAQPNNREIANLTGENAKPATQQDRSIYDSIARFMTALPPGSPSHGNRRRH